MKVSELFNQEFIASVQSINPVIADVFHHEIESFNSDIKQFIQLLAQNKQDREIWLQTLAKKGGPKTISDLVSANFPELPTIKLEKAVNAIQHAYFRQRAFRQFESTTGINIDKQSVRNMLNVYSRLREGKGLPPDVQTLISKEKSNPNDVLTPGELAFFEAALNLPMVLNHASDQAQLIQKSGYILSSDELKRRRMNIKDHTPSDAGESDFVFFSFSFAPVIESVHFLGNADRFLVDYDKYRQTYPQFSNSMWTHGHFYAYDTEQTSTPISLKWQNKTTLVSMHYKLGLTPVPSYQRHIVFNSDGRLSSQILERQDEVSAGRHIKPFSILRMIEILRFIDPSIRAEILNRHHDQAFLAQCFQLLLAPGRAELHFPRAFRLENKPDIFSLESRSGMARPFNHELWKYVAAGAHSELQQCLTKCPQAKYYYYTYKNFSKFSLLNFAVLKKDETIVKLLMQFGFDANHEYLQINQIPDFVPASRTALQDAVETRQNNIVRLLLDGSHQDSSIEVKQSKCASVRDIDVYTAIECNSTEDVLRFLIQRFEPDQNNLNSLLLVAVYYQNKMAISLLIRLNANPNDTVEIRQNGTNVHIIPQYLRGTALTLAAEEGRVECLQLLIRLGANVNAVVKERYGNGDSALISAVKGLAYKRHTINFYSILDRCKQSLSLQKYHDAIQLLLDSGANLHYITGDGRSFFEYAQRYLQDKSDVTLKELLVKEMRNNPAPNIPAKTTETFNFNSSALIIGEMASGKALLAAKSEEVSGWQLPGGEPNFKRHRDLTDTAIELTGYQVGIDLTRDASFIKTTSLHSKCGKGALEVHHFNLKLPIHQHTIYPTVLVNSALERKIDGFQLIQKLHSIQFIPLAQLTAKQVAFDGVDCLVFSYQGSTFPLSVSSFLAELCNISWQPSPAFEEIILESHLNPMRLVESAMKKNKRDDFESLIQFGLLYRLDKSSLILKALGLGEPYFLKRIFELGIILDRNTFYDVFQSCYYHHTLIYTETLLELLFKAHLAHLAYTNRLIIEYACKHSFASLVSLLQSNTTIERKELALKAILYGRPTILKMAFEGLSKQDHLELMKEVLNNCLSLWINNKYSSCEEMCDVIEYLLPFFQYSYDKYSLIGALDEAFNIGVREEGYQVAFLQKILSLIERCSKHGFYTMQNKWVEQFYFNTLGLYKLCESDGLSHAKEKLTYVKTYLSHLNPTPSTKTTLIIATESPDSSNNSGKSGDFDYAAKLANTLSASQQNMEVHHVYKDSHNAINALVAKRKGPVVLHLMLNAPRTGFAVQLDHLRMLKQAGVNIVITAIEFAKHVDSELKRNTLAYLACADQTIFLDENDKQDAFACATDMALRKSLQKAKVINVPPTISSQYLSTTKKGSNIMCFGMLRRGKGFAHVLKLAELIKTSSDPLVNQKRIHIVGSIVDGLSRRNNTAYDPTLYQILCAMYPKHKDHFLNKSPSALVELFNTLKHAPPSLPIQLCLNVEEKDLTELFSQCEYAFYPAYRGATLRNSSISTNLAFGTIIYSHVTATTPSCLQKQGEYHQAMVLFEDSNYGSYAPAVLNDIKQREADKKSWAESYSKDKHTLNDTTRKLASNLLSLTMSDDCVCKSHRWIYDKMISYDTTTVLALSIFSSSLPSDSGQTKLINAGSFYIMQHR